MIGPLELLVIVAVIALVWLVSSAVRRVTGGCKDRDRT